MHVERGAVRVGMEIEVVDWNGRTYYDVAKDLVKAQYMQGPVHQWEQWHTYHCHCLNGGCDFVRRGHLVDPPLVSMTYDSSLPADGAEFIVSPVLLGANGLTHIQEIWETVVENAVWSLNYTDQKGRKASPSIHLHVSATVAPKYNFKTNADKKEEYFHALALFAPEIFALADTAGIRRGIKFRLPEKVSILNDPDQWHHGFVQIRQALPDKIIYIEWRLFEAAYTKWDYVEKAIYFAATLTRALLDRDVYNELMRIGHTYALDERELFQAVQADSVEEILAHVHPERLQKLYELCVQQIDDDDYGQQLIRSLFDTVMEKYYAQ